MKWLFLLFLPVVHYSNSQEISGVFHHFSERWEPSVHVMRLNSVNDIYTANPELELFRVPIDASGTFSFLSEMLSDQPTLYRLSLYPKGEENISDLIMLAPANFMVLLLDKKTEALIIAEDAAFSLHYSVKSTKTANPHIAQFLNTFFSPKKDAQPSSGEVFDLRNYAAKTDPIVSLMTFRQLFLHDSDILPADRAFYEEQCLRLEKSYPDLSYTHELRGIFPTDPAVSGVTVLSVLLILLLLVIGLLIMKRKRTKIPPPSDKERFYSLTVRERTILTLLIKGKSNQELADALNVEITTVKTHVANILRKLEIKSRKEVIRFAEIAEITGNSE